MSSGDEAQPVPHTPDHRPDEAASRSTLGTVSNAAMVLELLSEGRAHHQISELAQRSGLSLATLHRLLRSLVVAGLVEQHSDTARYGLGPEILRLAARYQSRLPVLRVLSPYLVELHKATAATIEVSMLVGAELVRLDRLEGGHDGVFREPHAVEAAVSSAAGRLLLGRADTATWTRAVQGTQLGEHERRQWQQAPYLALSTGGELEVAVPVVNRRDQPVAALSARVPIRAADPEPTEHLASQLLRVARAAGIAVGDG
jgi:IclR family acetate operon transcriptional repressor